MADDDIVYRLMTWADPTELIDEAIDEIERLRAAIDIVLRAIDDAGSHPEYHLEVRRRHEREWPTLWQSIASLREARRG